MSDFLVEQRLRGADIRTILLALGVALLILGAVLGSQLIPAEDEIPTRRDVAMKTSSAEWVAKRILDIPSIGIVGEWLSWEEYCVAPTNGVAEKLSDNLVFAEERDVMDLVREGRQTDRNPPSGEIALKWDAESSSLWYSKEFNDAFLFPPRKTPDGMVDCGILTKGKYLSAEDKAGGESIPLLRRASTVYRTGDSAVSTEKAGSGEVRIHRSGLVEIGCFDGCDSNTRAILACKRAGTEDIYFWSIVTE